jgi:pilus assembly protein FimV
VQTSVDEKTLALTADKLELSKGGLKASTAGESNTANVSRDEEKIAQERQAKDAAERLAELSKNIGELNKLDATLPVPALATPPLNPANAAPTPTPMANAASKTMPPSLIDRLATNPLVLPAAAGFLGLLLAWAWFRWRRNFQVKNDPFQAALHAAAQPASKADRAVFEPTLSAPSSEPPPEVDALTLAQAELAQGHEAEAETLLRNALKRTPQRLALHLELMAIEISRGDASRFEKLAIQALTITTGQGTDWEQICKNGQALDPTNPLYQAAPHPETIPAVALPVTSVTTSPTAGQPFDKLDFDLELDSDALAKAPPQAKP